MFINLFIGFWRLLGFRCQSPGSKVHRSKVQRLDNSRNKSDAMSMDRGKQPAAITVEPLNPEPLNLKF
jgi:hypothetical protein